MGETHRAARSGGAPRLVPGAGLGEAHGDPVVPPLGDEVAVGGDVLAGHPHEGPVVVEREGVGPVEDRVPARLWGGGDARRSQQCKLSKTRKNECNWCRKYVKKEHLLCKVLICKKRPLLSGEALWVDFDFEKLIQIISPPNLPESDSSVQISCPNIIN